MEAALISCWVSTFTHATIHPCLYRHHHRHHPQNNKTATTTKLVMLLQLPTAASATTNVHVFHTHRFDLIYLILDKYDEDKDRRLARHLISLYHEGATGATRTTGAVVGGVTSLGWGVRGEAGRCVVLRTNR